MTPLTHDVLGARLRLLAAGRRLKPTVRGACRRGVHRAEPPHVSKGSADATVPSHDAASHAAGVVTPRYHTVSCGA
jgi:hypothetical protein